MSIAGNIALLAPEHNHLTRELDALSIMAAELPILEIKLSTLKSDIADTEKRLFRGRNQLHKARRVVRRTTTCAVLILPAHTGVESKRGRVEGIIIWCAQLHVEQSSREGRGEV